MFSLYKDVWKSELKQLFYKTTEKSILNLKGKK